MLAQLAQRISTLHICHAALLADVTKLDQGLMLPNGTTKLFKSDAEVQTVAHLCTLYFLLDCNMRSKASVMQESTSVYEWHLLQSRVTTSVVRMCHGCAVRLLWLSSYSMGSFRFSFAYKGQPCIPYLVDVPSE